MGSITLEVRDAGPLDIDDAFVEFEEEASDSRGMQSCIVGGGFYSIYPTYVTICGSNS
jgi:hypothetical protein